LRWSTDQGSQFTSSAFICVLESRGIQNSMDGKRCWRDNVFVERLRRAIKYEEIYLRAYYCINEAKVGITCYLSFYSDRRPHQGLDGRAPDTIYFDHPPLAAAA